MTVSPIRFGQYIRVELKAGERTYDQAPQTRVREAAKQRKGIDVVLGQGDKQQLGVATGLHKTAKIIQANTESFFHEMANLSFGMAHATSLDPAVDRAYLSLNDSLRKIVDAIILKSPDADLPEQAFSPEPNTLESMPEAKFDPALGYENGCSMDRLTANLRNQRKTFAHLIDQLITVSKQLAPELSEALKNINGEVQFKIGHDLLGEEGPTQDTTAMLRTRARSFGYEVELAPGPTTDADAQAAYDSAFAESDMRLSILKTSALACNRQVTKVTRLSA